MTVSPFLIYVLSVCDSVQAGFSFIGTLITLFCCISAISSACRFGYVSHRILVGIGIGLSLLLLAAFVPDSETLSATISASQGAICEGVRK